MQDDREQEERIRKRQKAFKALTMLFQLALSAVCPIMILIFAGISLDSRFGNGHHWFTLAGVVTGIYSAYRGVWLLLRDNFLKKDDGKEEKKQ